MVKGSLAKWRIASQTKQIQEKAYLYQGKAKKSRKREKVKTTTKNKKNTKHTHNFNIYSVLLLLR